MHPGVAHQVREWSLGWEIAIDKNHPSAGTTLQRLGPSKG